jgi:hypothetical protein
VDLDTVTLKADGRQHGAGIFLALAAALGAFAVVWIRRRVS